MGEEIWKDIPGYEGLYQASNLGRIKSLKRKRTGGTNNSLRQYQEKILKPNAGPNGYVQVMIYNNNISKVVLIHRLIATSFIGNPENKPQVNHINGIKTDNRVENLEWCTQSENNCHAIRTGLRVPQYGSARPCAKLNEDIVRDIKIDIAKNRKLVDIANERGLNKRHISAIKNGLIWRRVEI